MTILQAAYLRDRSFKAASMAHFFVDILNNGRSLLVALLAVSIGLSNAQVGIALLLYNVGSSLSQPFFGLLADRYGPRRFVVGGLAWMILLYSLAAVVGDWPALLAISLAGLGSGAVHPSGTKVASETSATDRSQATGVFFAMGQVGLFIGPVLAGVMLTLFDQPGYLFLTGLATIGLYYIWRFAGNDTATVAETKDESGLKSPATAQAGATKPATVRTSIRLKRVWTGLRRVPWTIAIPLVIVIVCYSSVGIAIINYAAKLFTEMGYQPLYVGVVTGLFMLGSAAGGIVGGTIADRSSRRLAIRIGMLGSIIPLFLYIPVGDPWRFPLLLMAGFFAGMPHSVLVIMAQALMPGRRGFASGLILGLMFFSGAIGTFVLALVADSIGLAVALQALIILPIVGTVGTFFLPGQEVFARLYPD